MDTTIEIDRTLSIGFDELTFSASRSSGPGGQHVNKVSSRITLRFDVDCSPSLSDAQRARIRERLATRINQEGILMVHAQQHRSQLRNRELAIERFADLLRQALHEDVVRKATRTPRRAHRKRVEHKRRKSQTKALRKRPSTDD